MCEKIRVCSFTHGRTLNCWTVCSDQSSFRAVKPNKCISCEQIYSVRNLFCLNYLAQGMIEHISNGDSVGTQNILDSGINFALLIFLV